MLRKKHNKNNDLDLRPVELPLKPLLTLYSVVSAEFKECVQSLYSVESLVEVPKGPKKPIESMCYRGPSGADFGWILG